MCKPGYYFPNVTAREKYFNGSVIEAEAADQEASYYSNPDSFQCLKCQPGCKTCEDSSPCIVTMNWPLRKALMGLTAVSIIADIGIMAFVIHFRELKVRKVCWRVMNFGTNSLGNLAVFANLESVHILSCPKEICFVLCNQFNPNVLLSVTLHLHIFAFKGGSSLK